eukprot:g3309.t1
MHNSAIERLYSNLQWRKDADDDVAARWGWSVVTYAAIGDDNDALCAALKTEKNANVRLRAPFVDLNKRTVTDLVRSHSDVVGSGGRSSSPRGGWSSPRNWSTPPSPSALLSRPPTQEAMIQYLEDEPLAISRVGLVDGATPLMMALRFAASEETIATLLGAGADPSLTDSELAGPIQWACRSPVAASTTAIQYLLRHKRKNENEWVSSSDLDACMWDAVQCRGNDHLDVVQTLLKAQEKDESSPRSISPRRRDSSGATIIMRACENPDINVRVVESLLQQQQRLAGPGVNARWRSESFVSRCRTFLGRFAYRYLRPIYPTPSAQVMNEGTTALHVAATNGEVDVIRCLLRAGADVTTRSGLGLTPTEHAWHFGGGLSPEAGRIMTAALAAKKCSSAANQHSSLARGVGGVLGATARISPKM